MVKQAMAIMVLALLAIMSVGCCGKEPRSYNITVALDDEMRQSLTSRKIEVHLVGISEKQNDRWETYSMTKYWQPGDTLPNSVPTFKMTFDPSNSSPQTLSKDDPIWKTWLDAGANRLYVIALLPGMIPDADSDKDPRRQIEPLACYRWPNHEGKIDIKIQKSGVTTLTLLRTAH